MELRINKLDEDEYDAPHVELFISDDGIAAHQDSYINDAEWLEFGSELTSFPKHIQHQVVFENGSPEGQYYSYILLRAFVYDGVGHSALEVKISNSLPPPHQAAAHFYILCEAATLNRLGHSLELWMQSRQPSFVFSTSAVEQTLGADSPVGDLYS